jgi:hypothetical protein
MARQATAGGQRVPLSEDPTMGRLEGLVRQMDPERREALMDYLNREAAEEEEVDNGPESES